MQAPNLPRLALATAITATCVPALADTETDTQQLAALDAVVVTATRTPQTMDDTLSAMTVLDREDIERSQTIDLPSLLSRQPGLNVTRNGAFGQNTSLFIRGTNSDHALVMIDGLRIGSATTGQSAFEQIPLSNLQRVEIVRGPRSSIYGSDAIGGVVQMFTRGERMFEGQRVRGGLMTGGNDTSEVTAGFDFGDGKREVSVNGRSFDTDGIKVSENSVTDNGFDNDSASLRYAQQIGERVQWRFNGLYSSGTAESDGFSLANDLFTDFVQQAVSTEFDIALRDWWQMNVRLGQSRDETENFNDNAPGQLTSSFDTQQDQLSWTNEFFVGEHHQVITGLDARDDQVDSTTDFAEDSRYNVGAFGVYIWDGERTDFEVSLRQDDNEAFGDETTGGVAGAYRVGETTRIRGSVGTAFNAPTFNELFFPDVGFFAGNPDLDPEESTSYEIGIEGGDDLRWGVNVFRTEIDDVIVFDGVQGTSVNRDEATIEGLELTSTVPDLAGWRLQASAIWLDPVADSEGGADDTDLPRRPDRKFTLDVDRDIGPASIGFSVRHEGERFDDAANTVELDEFTVLDLRAAYRFNSNIRLRGSVENAADENYETVSGFDTLPRTFFLRLEYNG